MGSLEDRIAKLEAARGAQQEDAEARQRSRTMDRMLHAMANGRRELLGLPPEPLPRELRETKSDLLDTLQHTIPWYRSHGGWDSGEEKAFLDQWEDRLLERLADLERGAQSDG